MKKIIIIILLIISAAGIVIYFNKADSTENTDTPISSQDDSILPTNPPAPQSDPDVKTYTMEEVRKHGPESWATGDSSLLCWIVIHGKVYEIPDSFAENHPGGHVIYDGCGMDATEFFETRPQGSGTPHSETARALLKEFYIGDLED